MCAVSLSTTAAYPAANWAATPPPPSTVSERANAVAARVAEDLRATRLARLTPARMKRATLRRISFDAWYQSMRASANARDVLARARRRTSAEDVAGGETPGTFHPQAVSAARLLVSLGRGYLVYEGYDDVLTGGLAISYWTQPGDRSQVTTASERHVLHTLGERSARRALRALAIGLDHLDEVAR